MSKHLFSKNEKLLLFIMASIQFNHIVDFMILMPLGVKLMPLFNITPREFGLLVSIYTLSAAFSGLVASVFMDKYDRKNLLILFFMGFTIGTLSCALSPNYHFLFFARAITGAFGGVLNSLVLSIVSDAISFEKRGTALGIVSTAFSLASIIGVPFSLFLANHWEWHSPFVFLSLLSLLILGLIIFIVPKQKHHIHAPARKQVMLEPLLHVLKSPSQMWALFFSGLLVLSQFVIIPFLSPSMVANAGLAESQLPLIYLIGGSLTIITGPWIGRLSDRYGKKMIFNWAMITSMIPILIITNMSVMPVYYILATTGFFFICISGRMVPAMTMISATTIPEYRGSFMSLVSSVQQFSSAMAATLAGLIITKSDAGRLENYPLVGLIALFFSLLALFISRKLILVEDRKSS